MRKSLTPALCPRISIPATLCGANKTPRKFHCPWAENEGQVIFALWPSLKYFRTRSYPKLETVVAAKAEKL